MNAGMRYIRKSCMTMADVSAFKNDARMSTSLNQSDDCLSCAEKLMIV